MNKLIAKATQSGFKKRLIQKCVALIESRIATNYGAMAEAQASANTAEKSSAGDKYETSRAMSHLEKDMHARQLAANQLELSALVSVGDTVGIDIVTTGSFIQSHSHSFFIAAGLGKINFEGMDVFLLSPKAVLGVSLLGKKKGDLFFFNQQEMVIASLF